MVGTHQVVSISSDAKSYLYTLSSMLLSYHFHSYTLYAATNSTHPVALWHLDDKLKIRRETEFMIELPVAG